MAGAPPKKSKAPMAMSMASSLSGSVGGLFKSFSKKESLESESSKGIKMKKKMAAPPKCGSAMPAAESLGAPPDDSFMNAFVKGSVRQVSKKQAIVRSKKSML